MRSAVLRSSGQGRPLRCNCKQSRLASSCRVDFRGAEVVGTAHKPSTWANSNSAGSTGLVPTLRGFLLQSSGILIIELDGSQHGHAPQEERKDRF